MTGDHFQIGGVRFEEIDSAIVDAVPADLMVNGKRVRGKSYRYTACWCEIRPSEQIRAPRKSSVGFTER